MQKRHPINEFLGTNHAIEGTTAEDTQYTKEASYETCHHAKKRQCTKRLTILLALRTLSSRALRKRSKVASGYPPCMFWMDDKLNIRLDMLKSSFSTKM
jgi:hypothetical protein